MLTLQRVAGLLVVELVLRRVPMQQREICTVMLQVAANAVLSIGIRHAQVTVIAVVRCQILRYFLVTVQTFERRRFCTELMAARALRRSRQRLVRFRKRPGRYLSGSCARKAQERCQRQKNIAQ